MKIYNGKIKSMYVKSVSINGDKMDILTESVVLKDNSPFYINGFGRMISLEHNTFLPTYNEADCFVRGVIMNNPGAFDRATCVYANYGEMEAREITKNEFKELKHTYRKIRKEKKN